jgi:hypothetical protein
MGWLCKKITPGRTDNILLGVRFAHFEVFSIRKPPDKRLNGSREDIDNRNDIKNHANVKKKWFSELSQNLRF